MYRIIGIGEYAISDDSNVVIKTYALSSCVALTAYSPFKKILGMVHIALPNLKNRKDMIHTHPAYYADTAIPFLFQRVCLGYGCEESELEIRLFGGAESGRKDDVFNIGRRNLDTIHDLLGQKGLSVCYSDTGGCISRSIEADVATGTVKVLYQPLAF